ncbi:cytochrome c oxidase subunit V [Sclerotinia borealis F-4128]|uniref:Cytochrome c oxidase polypeptide V n=1 Tax=Sclerotinia borealis (strain F-4128) TaxID=1432307 RepID=W9CBS1_SCLBF|nr:cytochrome c oxidase subunit V [Sclerotinia borealis F-4128]
MFRTPIARSVVGAAGARATGMAVRNQVRCASAHAISNPTLADIEKRWEGMPPQEQADLWMSLRDRMKINWAELTLQEKKAAYYIAFGAHGPRAQTPPGEGWRVAAYTFAGVGVSLALFLFIRMFAKGSPSTMNKEWQEATNEYLKSQNSEPISGISSEGYVGPGQVQSAPKKN